MLLIVCSALFVAITSICLGYAAIARIRALSPDNLADTVFASYWVGLSTLLLAATVVVCFVPLGSFGLVGLLVVLCGALATKPVRNLVAVVRSCFRREHVLAVLCGFAGICLLSLLTLPWHDCHDGRVCLTDTALYHAQLTRWYSTLGAVPGMALLHHRLGFHSSLFALAAVFDRGPLTGRAGCAVTLATVLVCLIFAALGLLRRQFSARTLFWPAFVLLVLCTFDITIAADDPDTTLVFMDGALFWMAWTWWESGVAGVAGWALILTGAGAMSIKLSGMLLLGLAVVLSIIVAGISTRVILKYGALAFTLMLPILAVQGITSGHPLYPVLTAALPVSWAAPDSLVLAVRNSIKWGPLYGYDKPYPMTLVQAASKILFSRMKPNTPYVAGVIAVFLTSLAIAWKAGKRDFPVLLAAALGAVGMIQLIQVAQPRFTVGYLAVLPALMLARSPLKLVQGVLAATIMMMYAFGTGSNRLDIARLLFYLAAIAWLTLRSVPRTAFSMRVIAGVLFLGQLMRPFAMIADDSRTLLRHPAWVLAPEGPLEPPAQAFREAQLGEVKYEEPVDGFHCWAVNLPCAPPPYQANWLTLDALQYRCDSQRLACGFTATPKP